MTKSYLIEEIRKKQRGVYTLRFKHKSIEITENFIADYHLYKGKEIDEALIEMLEEKFVFESCYQKGLALLARRDHFKRELAAKLAVRGFNESVIKASIDRLCQMGLIDEWRTARQIVDLKIKKESVKKTRAYLINKGCPSHIINQCFEGYDESELDKAYQALLKKAKQYNATFDNATKQKIYRHLLAKGFNYEDVKAAYKKYVNNQ